MPLTQDTGVRVPVAENIFRRTLISFATFLKPIPFAITSQFCFGALNGYIAPPLVSFLHFYFTEPSYCSMTVKIELLFATIIFHYVTGFTLPLTTVNAKLRINSSTRNTARFPSTKLDMSSDLISKSEHVLFDMPVSNNGARCRIILYKKELTKDQVEIISPVTMGGLKSPEYLARSPLGLMPCLSIQKEHISGMKHISESDTIARYLLSEYSDIGPSFAPDNPRSNQIARWHDMYLTTIQGCLVSSSYYMYDHYLPLI